MRADGRKQDEFRSIKITPNYLKFTPGSVLIEIGDTKVLCAATVENKVPSFLRGEKKGWLTAEYSLLPQSTEKRTIREVARGKIAGRTSEIQRLIGRSLRSVMDLVALGEKTVWIDCDVIQADGGTRTAAITGAFVALVQAMHSLQKKGELKIFPVKDFLAATSVGIVAGNPFLDLNYAEDFAAEIDMNVVITGQGKFIEVQGTAEGKPCTREDLDYLLDLAILGIEKLINLQKEILGEELSSLVLKTSDRCDNKCSN